MAPPANFVFHTLSEVERSFAEEGKKSMTFKDSYDFCKRKLTNQFHGKLAKMMVIKNIVFRYKMKDNYENLKLYKEEFDKTCPFIDLYNDKSHL